MKTGILCSFAILGISLILVAGCTTSTPGNTAPAGSVYNSAPPGNPAPGQDTIAMLVNGTYSINASVYQITPGRSLSGSHTIDVYVTATNTGTSPVQLRWFSKITNADGVSFGGIGVSHGGYGAETDPIMPGGSETPRDYVTIDSDQAYQALSRGATLNVYFITEPLDNQAPVSFSTTWTLDPAQFT